jgi:hypothetical protein
VSGIVGEAVLRVKYAAIMVPPEHLASEISAVVTLETPAAY